MQPIANIIQDSTHSSAVGLPPQYVPTAPPVAGSAGSIKSYILPDGKTGAVSNTFCEYFITPSDQSFQMYVSTFSPANFEQFQHDVEDAVKEFTSKGVTKLIVDLHNNGGKSSVGFRFVWS